MALLISVDSTNLPLSAILLFCIIANCQNKRKAQHKSCKPCKLMTKKKFMNFFWILTYYLGKWWRSQTPTMSKQPERIYWSISFKKCCSQNFADNTFIADNNFAVNYISKIVI